MNTSVWILAASLVAPVGLVGCGAEEEPPAVDAGADPLGGGEMEVGLKKAMLREEIAAFAGVQKRNPDSLAELAKFSTCPLPDPPPGTRWDYQPEVGSVEAVAK